MSVLDPLGADLKPGPGLYRELMRKMARSLLECLDANG
jgi:ABC-type Zn2+ transport system substrate-binding protein/surface adhesin